MEGPGDQDQEPRRGAENGTGAPTPGGTQWPNPRAETLPKVTPAGRGLPLLWQPQGACTLPEKRAPYVSLVVVPFVQPGQCPRSLWNAVPATALKVSPQSLGPTWGIEDIEGPLLSEVQGNAASPLRKLVRDELGLEHTISDAKFVAQSNETGWDPGLFPRALAPGQTRGHTRGGNEQ
ncbi:hypothetical protein R6Z07M_010630 [Ovis aries]